MTQKNSHRPIEGIARRIGIDLTKDVSHVAAMDARGHPLLQKRFTRPGLLEFLSLIKPISGTDMEACAGAHYLAGKMQEKGLL